MREIISNFADLFSFLLRSIIESFVTVTRITRINISSAISYNRKGQGGFRIWFLALELTMNVAIICMITVVSILVAIVDETRLDIKFYLHQRKQNTESSPCP